MDYRVDLRKDTNSTILATFPDLPGVHTYGDNRDEVLARASDALLTGLEFMIRTRRPIPAPKASGGSRVVVPVTVAAKIELHNCMVSQNVNQAELSRRLKTHRQSVERLVDVRHSSRMEQLEEAFRALGQCVDIVVAKAPKGKAVA